MEWMELFDEDEFAKLSYEDKLGFAKADEEFFNYLNEKDMSKVPPKSQPKPPGK